MITAYISNDSYEKVVAFYRGIGKDYTPNQKRAPPQLPHGQRLRKTFVILDGSVDLESSKNWVAVQHPFFGAVSLSGGKPQYNDVRDATEIAWTKKEAVKKQQAKQSDQPDNKPAGSQQ